MVEVSRKLSSAVMAEVSRKLGVGFHKLALVQTTCRDRQLAASPGPCLSVGTVLENTGDVRRTGTEERKVGGLRLRFTGTGSRYELVHCPTPPALTGDWLLLDSVVADITERLPPSSCRMACWANRSVLLTPWSNRGQKPEYFCRSYCTLLLLMDRQPRRPPRVTLTQACSWSSSRSPLHRGRTAYYEILQVSPNATQAQIKTAYYKQSFLYHPDKNAGSEEASHRFSQISEAYSILGSVGLRKKYDRGILSSADIQGAGRPSGKEASATSRPPGPQHQGPHRPRQPSSTTVGGKPVFDFDAFYQAHYGEQLQREQALRQWRRHLEHKKQSGLKKWKLGKMMEMLIGVMLIMGGAFISSLRS